MCAPTVNAERCETPYHRGEAVRHVIFLARLADPTENGSPAVVDCASRYILLSSGASRIA